MLDFLAIGDTAVDEFIRLKDARVTCDIHDEHCTISMRWGDKIPFESATLVPGVGNAANAAVAASRLGLSSALLAHIGTDRLGDEAFSAFTREKLDTSYIERHDSIPTNHHYVLWFESERTILVKHEAYPYRFPPEAPAPKALYLSSLGEGTEQYHREIGNYIEAHPALFFAFQPGTFQMKMGKEVLTSLYRRADFFACNKEEAERILERKGTIRELIGGLRGLGPKIVILTDNRNGAYAFDGKKVFFVPLYPDPRPPFERTGAGDAFASSVAAALVSGLPLPEALLWGPVNAMSVVQKIGAQEGLLTRAELDGWLKKAPPDYQVTEFVH